MLAIEMCGLPGCGKSMLMRRLSQSLTEQGYRVESEQSFHSANQLKSGIHILKLLSLKYPIKLKKRLLWMAFHYNKKAARYAIRILEDLDYIERAKKANADFMILDEGCIQHLSAMAFLEPLIIPEDLARELHALFYTDGVLVLKCVLPMQETTERIVKRNKPGDRYLHEESDKTIAELEIKANNIQAALDSVRPNEIKVVDMRDTAKTAEELAVYLCKNKR